MRNHEMTDFGDPIDTSRGIPYDIFARLRAEAPVWWHEPTVNTPDGEGFWVISDHANLMTVARDAQTFSSQTGTGHNGAGGTLIENLPVGIVGVLVFEQ
jgi:cytochrome P450